MYTSDILGNLKRRYGRTYREIFNLSQYLFARIRKSARRSRYSGSAYYVPVHRAGTSSIGPRAESGPMPTAGQQQVVQLSFTPKALFATISIGVLADLSTRNEGAFYEQKDLEMQATMAQFMDDVNRQLHGDGTGVLASITASATSATHTVDDTTKLRKGEQVEVATKATGVIVSGGSVTVQSVNHATSTVTFSASLTLTSAHGIYRYGLVGSDVQARNNALTGLGAIFDNTNTYGGINRATAGNEYLHSQSISGAEGLIPSVIDRAMTLSELEGNGNRNSMALICHPSHINNMKELSYGTGRTWNDDVGTLDFGVSVVKHGELEIIGDKYHARNSASLLDLSWFELLEARELGWWDPGSGIWLPKPATSTYDPAVMAFMMWFGEIACANPAAQVRITNLPTASY